MRTLKKTITVIAFFMLASTLSAQSSTHLTSKYTPNSEWRNLKTNTGSCWNFLWFAIEGKEGGYKNYKYRLVVTNRSNYPVSFNWQWEGQSSASRVTVSAGSEKTLYSYDSDESPISVEISKVRAIKNGRETAYINCYSDLR